MAELQNQREHCRFFLTEKGCRFSDRCRFEHIKDVLDNKENGQNSKFTGTGLLEETSNSVHNQAHVRKTKPPTSAANENDLQIQKEKIDVEELPEEVKQQAKVVISEENSSEKNLENSEDVKTLSQRVGGAIIMEVRQIETSKVKGQTSTKRRPLCRYFMTKRGCLRGENCKFARAKKREKSTCFDETSCACGSENQDKTQEEQNSSETLCDDVGEPCIETTKIDRRGDDGFLHSKRTETRKIFKKPGFVTGAKLSSLSTIELQELRKVEIKQLHRRFGGQGKIKVLKDDNEDAAFEILFSSSDPDWPFDVSEIVLHVQFNKEYPRKVDVFSVRKSKHSGVVKAKWRRTMRDNPSSKVLFPTDAQMFCCYMSEDQELPQQLIRYVNEDIKKWITDREEMRQMKDTVELPFRPFLRWLDRNLELLFIKAGRKMKMLEEAEAAGFEFVPYHFVTAADSQETALNSTKKVESQSINSLGQDEAESSLTDSHEKNLNLTSQCQNVSQSGEIKTEHASELHPSDNSAVASGSCNSAEENLSLSRECSSKKNITENIVLCSFDRKGTEIKLKGLELNENTSTVRASCVALTMECARCKGREDHQLISSRCQSVQCPRCFTSQSFTYRSSFVHPTSSVLGYLDLESCHPFDLVLTNCEFLLGCLNCSHETPVKGLCYGSTHRWCSHCHGKLSLQLESTRFYQLQPLAAKPGKPSITEDSKPKKEPKTPGLKTGRPLPDNGSCKHYKKSFRWLRFPCCGKCYPCDVCHDEKEDHEMKFATRMVCGYCSKEQPYSQNPCIECKSSVTKSRTSHWEGGKGCRDKIHMSRSDDRKYKNLSKTVSRKAVSRKPGSHKGKSQSK